MRRDAMGSQCTSIKQESEALVAFRYAARNSSPSVTGGDEDGLLTMGEILQLRLNADWIVLSACNTGSPDGRGAEAVSGLGRAFFYAGARSLLVSNWPVETNSAKALTSGGGTIRLRMSKRWRPRQGASGC